MSLLHWQVDSLLLSHLGSRLEKLISSSSQPEDYVHDLKYVEKGNFWLCYLKSDILVL